MATKTATPAEDATAKVVGLIWVAVGIAFGAWKTRGFRGELVNFDLPPDESAHS